jgi:hypothetical protein
MIKYRLLFISIVCSLIITGCKTMYIPNAQNVPLLREKWEVRVNATPTNYSTAFATGKHMGVVTSGQFRKSDWKRGNYTYNSTKWVSEGGSGTFFSLGKTGVFEIYTGGGAGGASYDRSHEENGIKIYEKFNANYIKTFFQPAIGTTAKDVDFAFSVRYVGLKFNKIDTIGYTSEYLEVHNLEGIGKPFYSFIEPALTLRVGGKYVKMHTQLLSSFKLNEERLRYKPFIFNIGLNLCIAKRLRKPKPEEETK